MRHDDLAYVEHMLLAARSAHAKTTRVSRAQYDANEDLRLAIVHLLQVIGEAARGVSPAFRAIHPEVPWAAIVGMRHRIVHDYLRVDEDVVWRTARESLPELIALPEPLVPPALEE